MIVSINDKFDIVVGLLPFKISTRIFWTFSGFDGSSYNVTYGIWSPVYCVHGTPDSPS